MPVSIGNPERLPDGREVFEVLLWREGGLRCRFLTLGATLASLRVPLPGGGSREVVLGYPAATQYLTGSDYLGAVVGRYCNRIRHGRFSIGGRQFQLDRNEGDHHLHGGPAGFHRRCWTVEPAIGFNKANVTQTGEWPDIDAVRFHLVSEDGDQGYPGRVEVTVTCRLQDDMTLVYEYEASSDRPTIINLTQHAYFNLGMTSDVLDHRLQVNASRYAPIDESLLPDGTLADVAGTPLDFRQVRRLGDDIRAPLLRATGGYDHSLLLASAPGQAACMLVDPDSVLALTVSTDQPAVHVYTGNFLGAAGGTGAGRRQLPVAWGRHAGVCLETQHFADSPNQPGFPSTLLLPGSRFRSTTSLGFSRPSTEFIYLTYE
ncbi:MAG: aldose epimerase family protein [Pseudomonadota bacterium]